ncbi:MAG TPA: MliC family protein [Phenylobacterium sp.]|nr:MliC family protein [Phenylobacterium sp.]
MKTVPILCVALAASAITTIQTRADPAAKPPMNDFGQAFYKCDEGNAFMMSYDQDDPSKASMTTSNGNKRYDLKRTQSPNGAEYAGSKVSFWTDGKSVVVKGTTLAFKNCKTKPS